MRVAHELRISSVRKGVQRPTKHFVKPDNWYRSTRYTTEYTSTRAGDENEVSARLMQMGGYRCRFDSGNELAIGKGFYAGWNATNSTVKRRRRGEKRPRCKRSRRNLILSSPVRRAIVESLPARRSGKCDVHLASP